MRIQSLHDLYVDELKDLYNAEKQLVKALPKLAKAASHADLKRAFTDHLRQTEEHVNRLEQIFSDLDVSPRGKKCVGMEGIIEEANEALQEKLSPQLLDAALICKAQHAEHYEMAGYGTVRTFAEELGQTRHVDLLEQTLSEEKQADQHLTQLAISMVNMDAEQDIPVSREASASRGRATNGRSTSSRGSTTRSSTARGNTTRGESMPRDVTPADENESTAW
jgi:ferritin-like metal-binding protein YciE